MGKVLRTYPHIITSPYGKRGNSWHGGVDITGYNNGIHVLDYICAKAKGTVVAVRSDCKGFEAGGSYGNYIIIDHGSGYKTVYAHMAYGSVKSKVGDKVSEGQVIGYMGNTGTSYGGHLHFEVRINNKRIDPTQYLDKELPLEEPKPTKSIDEVARDVINGNYGNYPERKARLEAEGYNYAEVQARVNEIWAAEHKPEPPKPVEVDINPGDTVIVNGIGYANSYGGGAHTRYFTNHKMKVIAEVTNDRKCPFALNQYNSGNVGDYSQVTAWFAKADIRKV